MNEMKEILLPGEPKEVKAELPQADLLLFAPMDKRAFGAAIGVVAALAVILITAEQILVDPHPSVDLELLSQYFSGYRVSWTGALIGMKKTWLKTQTQVRTSHRIKLKWQTVTQHNLMH